MRDEVVPVEIIIILHVLEMEMKDLGPEEVGSSIAK